MGEERAALRKYFPAGITEIEYKMRKAEHGSILTRSARTHAQGTHAHTHAQGPGKTGHVSWRNSSGVSAPSLLTPVSTATGTASSSQVCRRCLAGQTRHDKQYHLKKHPVFFARALAIPQSGRGACVGRRSRNRHPGGRLCPVCWKKATWHVIPRSSPPLHRCACGHAVRGGSLGLCVRVPTP